MKEKQKMDRMMEELEQPQLPHLTIAQQLHKLTSSKSFRKATKYTLVGILSAVTLFSLIKFAPTIISNVDYFVNYQKLSAYEDRFGQVKNYAVLEDYALADSMITSLESDMKDDGASEIVSLLETIVAYDKNTIDPILQRTASQQAAYAFQTQTQQAIDLSQLLTQQAFEMFQTETQSALDWYLTQTEQAKPTNTPTITLTPTLTFTPTITPSPTKTSTNTSTSTPTKTLTPIPSSTRTPFPTQTKPAATSTPVVPLREHYYTSLGSGVFSSVEYSDGMAAVSESVTSSNPVQVINPHTVSGLCGTSQYTISKIWFNNSASSDVTVNGTVIGHTSKTNSHGYLFNYTLNKGDQICFTTSQPDGFAFIIAPNYSRLYMHYDSYCYRGHCK